MNLGWESPASGSYFKPVKGLRQEDPVSPLLFNLVGETLTRMLEKAKDMDLIRGLLVDFQRGGIVSLQYTDDTILFTQADENLVKKRKCILVWFERISGTRINFHKNEIIPLNLSSHNGMSHWFIPHQIPRCPPPSRQAKKRGPQTSGRQSD